MNIDNYQIAAHQTSNADRDRIQHAIHGLVAEVGEIAGNYQRYFRGDFDYNEVARRLKRELGDVLWYAAELATVHDYRLSDIAKGNLKKLSDRMKRDILRGEGDER